MEELIQEYKKKIEAEKSKGTAGKYTREVRKFLEWVIENNLDLSLGQNLVQMYLDYKAENENWSKDAIKVAFYAIKKFFEKVKFIEIKREFFTNVGRKSGYVPVILKRDEVRKIFREADKELNLTERTMIYVGWEGALRASELVILKPKNFSLGKLYAKVSKTRTVKYKTVNLSRKTWNLVMSLIDEEDIDENEYLFKVTPKRKFKGITKRRWLDSEWSTFFGDFTESVLGRRIRWHWFARYTRLTYLAEQPDITLKDLLLLSGHCNPQVCLKYFKWAEALARKHRTETEYILKRKKRDEELYWFETKYGKY